MEIKNKKKCIGCANIANSDFPFSNNDFMGDNKKKGFFIDTEGCGIVQEGNYSLEIFFCPVCGIELKNE